LPIFDSRRLQPEVDRHILRQLTDSRCPVAQQTDFSHGRSDGVLSGFPLLRDACKLLHLPSTTVESAVPQNGVAAMKVYNTLGQEVAALSKGIVDTGKAYVAEFDGSGPANGMFLCRLAPRT
jgi:hypothetical protein